jgi:hypothetical protein
MLPKRHLFTTVYEVFTGLQNKVLNPSRQFRKMAGFLISRQESD